MTVIDKKGPPKFYIPILNTFGHFKWWMSRYSRLNIISLSTGKRFYKLNSELYWIVLFHVFCCLLFATIPLQPPI